MSKNFIYKKIPTLYQRDGSFKVDTTKLTFPEFDLINKWSVTEKIDGMNTSFWFRSGGECGINGRTPHTNWHEDTLDMLNKLKYDIQIEAMRIMLEHKLDEIVLFGETYGANIQNGGWYCDDQRFILFDVTADGRWLDEDQVTATAERLNIKRVPTLPNNYSLNSSNSWDIRSITNLLKFANDHYTQDSFGNKTFMPTAVSLIAENEVRNMEGVICKPPITLYDKRGNRIIFKLKVKDFPEPLTLS